MGPPPRLLLQAAGAGDEALPARAEGSFQNGAVFGLRRAFMLSRRLLQQPNKFVIQIADQQHRHVPIQILLLV
jgi:hypothetical protein